MYELVLDDDLNPLPDNLLPATLNDSSQISMWKDDSAVEEVYTYLMNHSTDISNGSAL